MSFQNFRPRRLWGLFPCAVVLLLGFAMLGQVYSARAGVIAQIPTGSVPTVTGTPIGALVTVRSPEQGFANLRNGPGTLGYEVIGALDDGAQIPALGRSIGGDWVLVAYPGVPSGVAWIYIDYAEVQGNLPLVEPPPTSTPRTTPTIDPTLAAQFLVEVTPTRLPTYTPPPPLQRPTFPPEPVYGSAAGVPMGFVIIGMAVVGMFGAIISFLRGR